MSNRIAVMSEGRVQQIGPPREIYEAPVNRFVADFIGETNLLEVEVAQVIGDKAEVILPGGHRLVCAGAATPGTKRHISIRPERVSLGPAGSGLAATVERVVYLGTDLQVMARLQGGAEILIRVQNAARIQVPEVGSAIGLQLEEGAARLLAD